MTDVPADLPEEPDRTPDPTSDPPLSSGPTDQLVDAAPSETVRAIEAILMVADRPVEAHLLGQVTETAPERIEEILTELAAGYEVDGRGFILVKVAGGYRYQSHPDQAPYIERFVLEGQHARLSGAALETLAIVAYKQPLSRAQVAAIRGVNVDGVMRTLEQRGYITEVARDPGPGNPILFGTTDAFLEKMGLGTLDDLPAITDFMPGSDVVEALEKGLRAEPEVPEVPEVPDDGSPETESADAFDASDASDASASAAAEDGGVVEDDGLVEDARPEDDPETDVSPEELLPEDVPQKTSGPPEDDLPEDG